MESKRGFYSAFTAHVCVECRQSTMGVRRMLLSASNEWSTARDPIIFRCRCCPRCSSGGVKESKLIITKSKTGSPCSTTSNTCDHDRCINCEALLLLLFFDMPPVAVHISIGTCFGWTTQEEEEIVKVRQTPVSDFMATERTSHYSSQVANFCLSMALSLRPITGDKIKYKCAGSFLGAKVRFADNLALDELLR